MFLKYCILILIGIIIFLLLNKNNIEGFFEGLLPDCRTRKLVKQINDKRGKYMNWENCSTNECQKDIPSADDDYNKDTMNPSCIQSCTFITNHEDKTNETFLNTLKNSIGFVQSYTNNEEETAFNCWKQMIQSGTQVQGVNVHPVSSTDISNIYIENKKNKPTAPTSGRAGRQAENNPKNFNLLSTSSYNCPACIIDKVDPNNNNDMLNRNKEISNLRSRLLEHNNRYITLERNIINYQSRTGEIETYDYINSPTCLNIANGFDRSVYKNIPDFNSGESRSGYFTGDENPQWEQIENERDWGSLSKTEKKEHCNKYIGCKTDDNFDPNYCFTEGDTINPDKWANCAYNLRWDACAPIYGDNYSVTACNNNILFDIIASITLGIVGELVNLAADSGHATGVNEGIGTLPPAAVLMAPSRIVGLRAAIMIYQDYSTSTPAHKISNRPINTDTGSPEEEWLGEMRVSDNPKDSLIKDHVLAFDIITSKINEGDKDSLQAALEYSKGEYETANLYFENGLQDETISQEDYQDVLVSRYTDYKTKQNNYITDSNNLIRYDSLSDRLESIKYELHGTMLYNNYSTYIERNAPKDKHKFNRFIAIMETSESEPGSAVSLQSPSQIEPINELDMEKLRISELMASVDNTLIPEQMPESESINSFINVTPSAIFTVNDDYLYRDHSNVTIQNKTRELTDLGEGEKIQLETAINGEPFINSFYESIGQYIDSIHTALGSVGARPSIVSLDDIINIIKGFMDIISLENTVLAITNPDNLNCFVGAGHLFVVFFINQNLAYIDQFLRADNSVSRMIIHELFRLGLKYLIQYMGILLSAIGGMSIFIWIRNISPYTMLLELGGLDPSQLMKLVFLLGYYTVDIANIIPYNPPEGSMVSYIVSNYVPSVIGVSLVMAAYRVFDDYMGKLRSSQYAYFIPRLPSFGNNANANFLNPATISDLSAFDDKYGTNHAGYHRSLRGATSKRKYLQSWKKHQYSPGIWPIAEDYTSANGLNFVTEYHVDNGQGSLILIPEISLIGASTARGSGRVVDKLTGRPNTRCGMKMVDPENFVNRDSIHNCNSNRLNHYITSNERLVEPDGNERTDQYGRIHGFAAALRNDGTTFVPCVEPSDFNGFLVDANVDYNKAFVAFSKPTVVNAVIQLMKGLNRDEGSTCNTCSAGTYSNAMMDEKNRLPYKGDQSKYALDPDDLFKDANGARDMTRFIAAMNELQRFNIKYSAERSAIEAAVAEGAVRQEDLGGETLTNRESVEAFLGTDNSLKAYYNLIKDKLYGGIDGETRNDIFRNYPNLITEKDILDAKKNGYKIETNAMTREMGIYSDGTGGQGRVFINGVQEHYEYINSLMLYGVIEENANFDTMLNRDTEIKAGSNHPTFRSNSVARKNQDLDGKTQAELNKFKKSIQWIFRDNIRLMVNFLSTGSNPRTYNRQIDGNNMDQDVANTLTTTITRDGIETQIPILLDHTGKFRTTVLNLQDRTFEILNLRPE